MFGSHHVVETGSVSLAGSEGRVVALDSGTRTYVAGGSLIVVDTSDRSHPAIVENSVEPSGLSDVALVGSVACTTRGNRVELIDVSEPGRPQHVGTSTSDYTIDRIVARGPYLVLMAPDAYSWRRLEFVNVEDPAHPAFVAAYEMADMYYLYDLAVEGNIAYVLGGGGYYGNLDLTIGAFTILDISDPLHPVERSTTPVSLNAAEASVRSQIVAAGGRVWISNVYPMDPEPNDTLETATDLGNVTGSIALRGVGNYSYDYPWLFNEADYYRFRGQKGSHLSVDLRGSSEGVGTTSGATLNLFSSSGQLLARAPYDVGGEVEIADYVLADIGDYYLAVFSPETWYYYPAQSYELAVAIDSPLPPVEPFNGVAAYDVSDPAHPALLSTANMGRLTQGIEVHGSHVYASLADPGMLEVWDYSDPAHPVRQGSAQVDPAGKILVAGNLAQVASGNRLQMVDVSNPELPVTLRSYQAARPVGGLATKDALTLMAADSLYLMSIQPEGTETPDLAVTELNSPPGAVVNTALEVSWAVRNRGRSPAEGTWTNAVYLSADPLLDPGDLPLGSVAHAGPLDSLDSYTARLSAALTGVSLGYYYVIVRADDLDNVDESFVEANNVRVSAEPIYVGYPDLAVTHIDLPAVAARGDVLPIQWRVYDRDFAPANGQWTERSLPFGGCHLRSRVRSAGRHRGSQRRAGASHRIRGESQPRYDRDRRRYLLCDRQDGYRWRRV